MTKVIKKKINGWRLLKLPGGFFSQLNQPGALYTDKKSV